MVKRLAFVIIAAGTLWPAVPAWAALIAGVTFALAAGNPLTAETKKASPWVLQASVVGLGASMNLVEVATTGARGFASTAIGITLALTLSHLIGKAFKTDAMTGVLIGVGTAICGGSAIAAVAPVVRARPEQISVALAVVFLLNAVALFVFPPLGHALGLTQQQFGLWAALAIHDTSSVVAAGAEYGKEALALATTVKLARALWIVPLTFVAARLWAPQEGAGSGAPKRPWFILGFVLAAALVTFVPGVHDAGTMVALLARRGLVLALFLIGAGITRSALAQVGARAFAHGVLLWLAVGVGSLATIWQLK